MRILDEARFDLLPPGGGFLGVDATSVSRALIAVALAQTIGRLVLGAFRREWPRAFEVVP